MANTHSENQLWNLCDSTYRRGYGIGRGVITPELSAEAAHEILHHPSYNYDDAWGSSDILAAELPVTARIHGLFNGVIADYLGDEDDTNYLHTFGIRMFPPGENATRIHRNSPFFGPWFFGITLEGEAPFHVYNNEVLEYGQTRALSTGKNSPQPIRTARMIPGSAWGLFTDDWSAPHCGGLVDQDAGYRTVLLLYGDRYSEPAIKKRSAPLDI
jgi:hypothetical protein